MHRHEPQTARRWIALALALLFVLQSAAQASSGCLPRVVSGQCCCASASGDAQVRACCAERAPKSEKQGTSFERNGGCHCELAPLPPASATEFTTSARAGLAERDGFRDWIASGTPGAGLFALATTLDAPRVVPRLDRAPPRTQCASATVRLVMRGMSAFLSDLGCVRL